MLLNPRGKCCTTDSLKRSANIDKNKSAEAREFSASAISAFTLEKTSSLCFYLGSHLLSFIIAWPLRLGLSSDFCRISIDRNTVLLRADQQSNRFRAAKAFKESIKR
jgi:hypothetical protein